jgi:hypothetical protein
MYMEHQRNGGAISSGWWEAWWAPSAQSYGGGRRKANEQGEESALAGLLDCWKNGIGAVHGMNGMYSHAQA